MSDSLSYYNENDEFAAAWLVELMGEGLIAPGLIDTRSIIDVLPEDLDGFTQCHFFAGIGGWSHALRLAGWPDDRPCWTGSCPCQPFSQAGQGIGVADERHLWPSWFWLIEQCRPSVVFGEQVTAAIKHGWLDLVQDDMEGIGYSFAAHGLAACNLGAPHQRKRLYFVADAEHSEQGKISLDRDNGRDGKDCGRQEAHGVTGTCGEVYGLADATDSRRPIAGQHGGGSSLLPARPAECGGDGSGRVDDPTAEGLPVWTGEAIHGEGSRGEPERRSNAGVALGDTLDAGLERLSGDEYDGEKSGRFRTDATGSVAETGSIGELGDSDYLRCGRGRVNHGVEQEGGRANETEWRGLRNSTSPSGITGGFWADAEWLWCRDEKYRPVEPGTFPLAHGATNRVGRLRGYGNAIVPQVAQAFIESYMEVLK